MEGWRMEGCRCGKLPAARTGGSSPHSALSKGDMWITGHAPTTVPLDPNQALSHTSFSSLKGLKQEEMSRDTLNACTGWNIFKKRNTLPCLSQRSHSHGSRRCQFFKHLQIKRAINYCKCIHVIWSLLLAAFSHSPLLVCFWPWQKEGFLHQQPMIYC